MTRISLEWEKYIKAPADADTVDRCRLDCANVFQDQRETLRELCLSLRPKRVGCLGAGCLNDIPIETFLGAGSEVYLVDWIPRISEEGFRSDLICREENAYACILCRTQSDPLRFCASFHREAPSQKSVCDHFSLHDGPRPRCVNYRPGVEPHFLNADVTFGRASAFAKKIGGLIASCKTPAQAFRKAVDEIRRCAAVREEIPILSDSLDLVTSSMVVSQFDHEPYIFFSKLLALRFGERILTEEEEQLFPLMERLRADLFRIQAEGHIKEIYRLVNKPFGKVFFSVEMFRSSQDGAGFFLVQEISQAMDTLGKYFHFDFLSIPPHRTLKQIETDSGISVVQSYLLMPKEKWGG